MVRKSSRHSSKSNFSWATTCANSDTTVAVLPACGLIEANIQAKSIKI